MLYDFEFCAQRPARCANRITSNAFCNRWSYVVVGLLFFCCGCGTNKFQQEVIIEQSAVKLARETVSGGYEIVTTDELKRLLDSQEGFLLVDAMPAAESYDKAHIGDAVNFEFPKEVIDVWDDTTMPGRSQADYEQMLGEDKERLVVVYCGFVKCARSHNAAVFAQQLGYSNVKRYAGGIYAWRGSGYPVANKRTPLTSNSMKKSDPNGERPEGIQLDMASWDELQHWVAEQRGKVVVVDVWSTYCPPCVREFPHFVALHNKHQDNVVCASLSLDFYGGAGNSPEDVRPQVFSFLKAQNATMANFISSDPDSEVLKQISTVAIPAALVYDRQGQLRKVFNNDSGEYAADGFSYEEHIIPVVNRLMTPVGM